MNKNTKRQDYHFFDITAEKEGVIGIIRKDDLKILSKQEPIVSNLLNLIMCKKSYSIIKYQFTKE